MKTNNIDLLMQTVVVKDASDLHLQVGAPPAFRVYGDLEFSDLDPVTEEDIETYLDTILNAEQKVSFQKKHFVDLSREVKRLARFRINVYKQREKISIAMRVIPCEVPTIDGMGFPEILKTLSSRPHGLILVTGATGSGKSTKCFF